MLLMSEIPNVVNKAFHVSKGIGARKLRHQLKEKYTGLSEPVIQKVLSDNIYSQELNVKFDNRAPIRSITAERVMGRLQIDLVNMVSSKIVARVQLIST
jgi:hypothetical protein